MERIGEQKTWSFLANTTDAAEVSNRAIRSDLGHRVKTYFELAMKVAELQFLNPEHVMMFRGQRKDHRTKRGPSLLKASIFRNNGNKRPNMNTVRKRFSHLNRAEEALVHHYKDAKFKGFKQVERHRIVRWAILQHYEICHTPLLDVTHSLRIAASFASDENMSREAFVFVFGVPNVSGAVTASSEAGLQIVRLSNACPPDAVRPHIQEGYLLGEYPEISVSSKSNYRLFELDFGRRLIAKFRFNPESFWSSENFPKFEHDALYPTESRDRLLRVAQEIKESINSENA